MHAPHPLGTVQGRWRLAGAALAVFGLAAGACRDPADTGAVALSCGGVGVQFDLCRSGAEAWARERGTRVTLVSTPSSSTERLALYQQLLAAGVPDIDVFQIDVVWPGILGGHFLDLAGVVPPDEVAAHFPVIIENNTVGGRLVALPWYTDAGVLYYRRDLLERHGRGVPATWQELTDTAALVQQAERAAGDDRLWGFVFQGRAYEGLTCNALEWVVSAGGPGIVGASGIEVDDAGTLAAIDLAASWIGHIAPPGVLNYSEEEARGVFQLGHAVFMRNWPYAWRALNAEDSPVRGNVGLAPLPAGVSGAGAATLGGWQLAVSRHSRHADAAIDLVRYLTGAAEQKRRAIGGGFLPTLPALYADADIRAVRPDLDVMRTILDQAVARPSRITGVAYNQVSTAFFQAVHASLAEPGSSRRHLEALGARLAHLSRGRRWSARDVTP